MILWTAFTHLNQYYALVAISYLLEDALEPHARGLLQKKPSQPNLQSNCDLIVNVSSVPLKLPID